MYTYLARKARCAIEAQLDQANESLFDSCALNSVTGTVEKAGTGSVMKDCNIKGHVFLGNNATLIGCRVEAGATLYVSDNSVVTHVTVKSGAYGNSNIFVRIGSRSCVHFVRFCSTADIANDSVILGSKIQGECAFDDRAIIWGSTIDTTHKVQFGTDALIVASYLDVSSNAQCGAEIGDGFTVVPHTYAISNFESTETNFSYTPDALHDLLHSSYQEQLVYFSAYNRAADNLRIGDSCTVLTSVRLASNSSILVGNAVTLVSDSCDSDLEDRCSGRGQNIVKFDKIMMADSSTMVVSQDYLTRARCTESSMRNVDLTVGLGAIAYINGAQLDSYPLTEISCNVEQHTSVAI